MNPALGLGVLALVMVLVVLCTGRSYHARWVDVMLLIIGTGLFIFAFTR